MKRVDLAVIGAGPAGMAAAATAARAGATVVIVDDHPAPGGKVLSSTAGVLKMTPLERYEAGIGRALKDGLGHHRIRCIFSHQVWHIEDGRRLYLSPVGGAMAATDTVVCRRMVIAAGAVERVLPFPGWTLPGVFTPGGLNGWARHGVVPGRRIVVAGTGPLLLALAHNLMRAGAHIVAVAQALPAAAPLRFALPLAATMGGYKAFQGAFILARLAARRIPLFASTTVAGVSGTGRVQQVDLARVDPLGRPMPGSGRSVRADVVAVGYGLIPSADLTRLCGCRDRYDADRGYWRVLRNRNLETSVAGVFAAGDGAAVKGYAAAADEGRLAGLVVAAQLGYGRANVQQMASLRRRMNAARRFGRILDALSLPAPGLFAGIPDNTTVCRCEEVTMGDLRQAAAHGAADINDLKRRTRMGMGHCQGRLCGQVANEALWQATGRAQTRDRFSSRIPAKPLAMENLLNTK